MNGTIIVWFRRDLRLNDNAALYKACEDGHRVLPVYIFSPGEETPWEPGAASRWWLHHSLRALDGDLAKLSSRLLILRGDALSMLAMLCERIAAHAVYWNQLYDPATIARDSRVRAALQSMDIRTRSFPGYLLREPWEVMTGGDTPYKVFTPYSRAASRLGDPPTPVEPRNLAVVLDHDIAGDGLDSLSLLPATRWDAGFDECWQAGEAAAWRRLEMFIDSSLEDYDDARDRPGTEGISRMSPHLHHGEISPGAIWHAVVDALAGRSREQAAFPYLRQLQWRDFAHQLLFHFPHITEENFKPAFNTFPWQNDSEAVRAWRRGRTGIPLVDAGMRELWHTGFMHNRIRMITASFLTKNAGVHWRTGARWFWDTLVDANLANNTMGWQWVAGCGPDAAPYFRIFNPVTQGQKFDGSADYVRHWVPELAGLPDRHIHSPWAAPGTVRVDAGVRLGDSYPEPVLDLQQTRKDALAAYKKHVKNVD